MKIGKNIFANGMWSILSLAFYQGMLQFVVYPYINRNLGVEEFGNMLYIAALLSVFAPAVGNAVGNVKVVKVNDRELPNGDYLLPLGLQTAAVMLVFIPLCLNYVNGAGNWSLLIITLGLTTLRCYGEATYRISLDFKGYFIYFLLLSSGYLLGLCIIAVTGRWIWSFLLGELLCVILLFIKGKNLWPFSLSPQWQKINGQSVVLTGAYLLSGTIAFLDRILLQQWIDSTAVSIYYVSSLVGKLIMLLVDPLNNVLLSYLAKFGKRITIRQFFMAFLVVGSIGGVLYGGVIVGSPIFIKLLYPELYQAALQIMWMVSLSQVFCAATSTFMIILLKECGVKWQLSFQLFYFLQYIALSFAGVKLGGIEGFAIGGMISNIVQLPIVFGVGSVLIKSNSNRGKTL